MKKVYPRARVFHHPSLDGWNIELLQREGDKPKKVAATYSSIPWAHRAARVKLGLPPIPGPAKPSPPPARIDLPDLSRHISLPAPTAPPTLPLGAVGPGGLCGTCNRPMRYTKTKAADHPGTVLRQREGLCQSCNQKGMKRT